MTVAEPIQAPASSTCKHLADQESFAVMPVPLDHDARQQDIRTTGTPHELDAIRAGWARQGTR
jgi:hypothetical protein